MPTESESIETRFERVDWTSVEAALDEDGCAVLPALLSPTECAAAAALYEDDALFRKRIVMERHGYGLGEYKYFAYPLPPLVACLREAAWPRLRPVANRWNEAMRIDARFPERLDDYLARCHAAGQTRPTPLLLSYEEGGYNCLHQDLYGDEVFPLQMALLLSRPGSDFRGGEFVMTEQRPRRQSRPLVLALEQGDAVVFAVRHRPQRSAKGFSRVQLRHGVSRIREGHRRTLGIIFHDAS